MQAGQEELKAAGIQVVSISYDEVDALAKFAKKQSITFSMLADPESEVIKQFSLVNEAMRGKKAGLAVPQTVIIDQAGVVLSKIPATTRNRHDVEKLIEDWNAVKDKASDGPFVSEAGSAKKPAGSTAKRAGSETKVESGSAKK